MKTNTTIPRLRFPEFRKDEGWKGEKLGDIATFLKGKGLPKASITPKGKYPCIHYGELFTQYAEVIDDIISHTDVVDKWIFSEKNDVLMPTSDVTPRGLAKASCIKKDNIILGGDILIIKTDIHRVKGEFLSRYIRFREQEVLQYVSGSTVYHLYASSINKLPIYIPTTDEQQKIADCLFSLDTLISSELKQLDALKSHKAGLLQQLFPAEGDTVPKLRFKEFEDDGDWEESSLNRVCDMKAGTFVPASEIKDISKDDLYPCYGGNGLRGFTQTYTHDGVFPLIGRQGALCGNINLVEGQFHATEHALVCTPESNIAVIWLYYQLVLLDLNKYATGQAQPGLSVKNLNDISLKVPVNYQEQQKIADCLSSLDALIQSQAEKIEALKQHKQGLMQQLFP